MNILVINCGSSSIKYELFSMPKQEVLERGLIDHIGEKDAKTKNHYAGLKVVLSSIKHKVDGIGHRVVHGGEQFKKPVLINKEVILDIRRCCLLAPLHNPANLAGVRACKKLMGAVPQVAVFDTAYHQTLPEYAYIYGLPYRFYQQYAIRRYGFHGSSHEYVAQEAARRLGRSLAKLKLITCHLGNGCSITAIKFGKVIDTSMGFTPLEGLIMGTRCGDIDPAIITYLQHERHWDSKKVENVLNKKSGLKGISGLSNDMRIIEKEAQNGNKRARLAIDVFVYRIRKYISAYAGIMGGCDAVIFTAGIGENEANLREKICQDLFSYFKEIPKILVVATNEELMIACKTYNLITKKRVE
ncbi:MAG: acetate kinase [Candidatus Omnitrophica bacterium]|nr:acetate kinase [Candidatus Omnitrophota bacterium]